MDIVSSRGGQYVGLSQAHVTCISHLADPTEGLAWGEPRPQAQGLCPPLHTPSEQSRAREIEVACSFFFGVSGPTWDQQGAPWALGDTWESFRPRDTLGLCPARPAPGGPGPHRELLCLMDTGLGLLWWLAF